MNLTCAGRKAALDLAMVLLPHPEGSKLRDVLVGGGLSCFFAFASRRAAASGSIHVVQPPSRRWTDTQRCGAAAVYLKC